jgi:hypothetical protein
MIRRYGALLAVVLGAAVALALLARLPRREAAVESRAVAIPTFDLALTLEGEKLAPEIASVPRGSRVRLRVENREPRAVTLRLAGYEDRLPASPLGSGEIREHEFLADRPGEDFAWLVDGEPRGRLAVTGSHLVEGHR